jgi:alkylated DNA repair dioxygenase AlkB
MTGRAKRAASSAAQGELSAVAPAMPEGFVDRDDVIAPGEEEDLLRRLRQLPFEPFAFHGFLGRRRVVSFGWRYDHGGRSLAESAPIASFLLPLRERAAAFAGLPADALAQLLVNEYDGGAGIGWHRDKPVFGEVVALSLGAACVLRFRRRQGAGWERAWREIRPRSAYLLGGPARWEWQHSIAPIERLRYSLTFRTFVSEAPPRPVVARPATR